jgi:translation initiation factor 2 alpha subunit (eIF-2alpha)
VTYASALFLSLTAVALIRRFGVVTRPFEVVATSQEAYRVLTDSTLTDDAKEAIMQQSAKTLARQFVVISAASLAAVAAPLGVVWVLAALRVVSLKAVILAVVSWQVLLSSTLLVTARAWYGRVWIGTH